MPIIKFWLIVTFLFSIISLSFLVRKTFSFGKKNHYAAPHGDVKKGIIYAFGKGMMPWEKESAGKHLPTYIAGICYHAGIFSAFLYLAVIFAGIRLPASAVLLFQVIFLFSFAAGLGLLVKRTCFTILKALSCPDDFAANILVDIFLLFSLGHTFRLIIAPFLFGAASILFLYIPLGKIRHCFFFFYDRIFFGIFYGRRGIFPHKQF